MRTIKDYVNIQYAPFRTGQDDKRRAILEQFLGRYLLVVLLLVMEAQ